ncbi:MAG: response regulator [Anaerolineales bacterium]|nr:response regulator [Anaerolineales bacterium]
MTGTMSNIQQSTSVDVQKILEQLAARPVQVIAEQWPDLNPDDVQIALAYAASLARQSSEPPASPAPSIASEAAANLNLNKVLVVDDTEDNLLLMKYIFKKSDFTLLTTSDPREALALAKTERPALIVSDVQMPRMSGFDLLQSLKADAVTQNIAVILVTAYHRSSGHASQGLNSGADDYIQRPFMPDEFMSRVEAVIRQKRAEIETRQQAHGAVQRNIRLQWVNELALAVNSSLELSEIFVSSMQKLSQLLQAEAVSIVMIVPDRQALIINFASRTGSSLSVPLDFDLAGQSATRPVEKIVASIVSHTFNQHAQRLGVNALPGDHTVQVIPMHSKERLVGAIAIIDKQGEKLNDADLIMLNSAAGIIGVAMENARLLEQAQQQVDDLIALTEIGRALTSNLNLDQVLKQTTLFIQRSLQCEAVSLWLLSDDKKELLLTTASGVGSELVTGFRMSIDQGIAGHVATTGEYYISTDLTQDKVHFNNVPNQANYTPRSILSVPVQAKGQIIGVMQALHQNSHWFSYEHLRWSYPVANFVGIAVENARLFQKVQAFSRHLEQMVSARTKELAEEKERTEAILASMADGLIVFDAEKGILTANKAAEQMLDFKLAAFKGQPVGPEQLKNPIWNCINDIINNDELITTAVVDAPDPQTGAVLSIQTHSAKVRNEYGRLIGTVIVLRDITALTEVERMKSRFMAGVTHELKTPLSIIRLHSKNLIAYGERLPAPKRNSLLNAIQSQAHLLGTLIEDILELSRFDAGMIETKRERIDLRLIIDKLINDLRPLAESSHIMLEWHKPAVELALMADALQIERVSRNLIDNAIKYTPSGGKIKVTGGVNTIKGKEFVFLQVTDTGMGIPADHLSKIFERFHRVDPSHTIPGTGLGLAIVKEIVNTHDGDIHVESTLGQGSTFTVRLPGPKES